MLATQSALRAATLSVVVWLSACSINSVPGTSPVPIEKRPDYSTVEPSTPQPVAPAVESSVSAAYGPLVAKAELASAKGDYEQALALLERAQRIDPNSAQIYLAMARTHDARRDYAQAQATAERGLLYCVSPAQCDALRVYTR